MTCPYEISYEGNQKVIRIKCGLCERLGDHHDSRCREGITNALAREGESCKEVILEREKEFFYPKSSTSVISEFASEWVRANSLLDDVEELENDKKECKECTEKRLEQVEMILEELLKDWTFGYRMLEKTLNEREEKTTREDCERCEQKYTETLQKSREDLKRTKLVAKTSDATEEEIRIGTAYDDILEIMSRPFFVRSGITPEIPEDAILEDVFEVDDNPCRWKIYYLPSRANYMIVAETPETHLSLLEMDLLRAVQSKMRASETEAILRTREPYQAVTFLKDLARRLILEEIRERKIRSPSGTIDKLSEIFGTYFGDLGILRRLIDCPGVTTVQVIHPPERTTVKVEHDKYGLLESGINIHTSELLRIISRIRYYTGRPFSKSNPFLDCDYMGVRISASQYPAIYEEESLGMTIAKPRAEPWTQPLFIEYNQLNLLASALTSELISAGRGSSAVIIGAPGVGKTSSLESLLLECPNTWNFQLIQDVREIHKNKLQELGYMFVEHSVRPDLLEESEQVLEPRARETAIHVARRRPHAFVLNEARSEILYRVLARLQGMTGTLSLSTLFARSSEDLWRTVGHTWGVPPEQFKQFDLIIQLSSFMPERAGAPLRRMTEVVEVGKNFEESPLEDGGFKRLMEYDFKKDTLVPTESVIKKKGNKRRIKKLCTDSWTDLKIFDFAKKFKPGDSDILRRVAESAKLTPKELLERILVNGKIKSDILELGRENPEFLESGFVVRAYGIWRDILTTQERLGENRTLKQSYNEFSKRLNSLSKEVE